MFLGRFEMSQEIEEKQEGNTLQDIMSRNHEKTDPFLVRRFWNENKAEYGSNGLYVEQQIRENIGEWIANWNNPELRQGVKDQLDNLKARAAQDFEFLAYSPDIKDEDLAVGYMFNIYSRARPEFLNQDQNSPQGKENIKCNNEMAKYFQQGDEGLKKLYESYMRTDVGVAKDTINFATKGIAEVRYLKTSEDYPPDQNVLLVVNNVICALKEISESDNPNPDALKKLNKDLEYLSQNADKLDTETHAKLKEFFKSENGKTQFSNVKKLLNEDQKKILNQTKEAFVEKKPHQKIMSKVSKVAKKVTDSIPKEARAPTAEIMLQSNLQGLALLHVEVGKIYSAGMQTKQVESFFDRLEKNPLIDRNLVAQWRAEPNAVIGISKARNHIEQLGATKSSVQAFNDILYKTINPHSSKGNAGKKPLAWVREAVKALPRIRELQSKTSEILQKAPGNRGPSR